MGSLHRPLGGFIQCFNGEVNKVLKHMQCGVSKESQSGVVQKAGQVPSPIFGHHFLAYSTTSPIPFFAHASSPFFLNFKAHPYIFPFVPAKNIVSQAIHTSVTGSIQTPSLFKKNIQLKNG